MTLKDNYANIKSRVRNWLKAAYHEVLLIPSLGNGIKRRLPGGGTVRVLPEARYIGWSEHECEAYRQVIMPGQVVLDIGANAGAYAMYFGHLVGPAGRVFAFEPAPETYLALVRHLRINGLERTVQAVNVAVTDRTGTAVFQARGLHGTNRLLGRSNEGFSGANLEVAVTSVDEFCAQEGILPDVIKIDVEGFELEVLRGARRTIRAVRSKIAIFVETHPAIWQAVGSSREELQHELEVQGLRAVPLLPGAAMWGSEGVNARLIALL